MDKPAKSRMVVDKSWAGEGSNSNSIDSDNIKISPTDFVAFLPWACHVLSVDAFIEVSRSFQFAHDVKFIRGKPKALRKGGSMAESMRRFATEIALYRVDLAQDENKIVRVTAIYTGEMLVHIKIDRTKHVPREVLLIIALALKFHPMLARITINSGANCYTIYELNKLLPISNICEINLDNTSIKEGNYDTILDSSNQLRFLSLSRCNLSDGVVEKITSKLEIPRSASKLLSVLNLSSNRITDKGAISLGKMLRTNVGLSYLNLAGNSISDEGMEVILNALLKFDLTMAETRIYQEKYETYLKRRQLLINKYVKQVRLEETKAKKTRKEDDKSNSDSVFYEKALSMANLECGKFDGPVGNNSKNPDGTLFSRGNNTLAYLNISYNNVSQIFVRKLLKVLIYQRDLARTPLGLINVSLEGNLLPEENSELQQIDAILTTILKNRTTDPEREGQRKKRQSIIIAR